MSQLIVLGTFQELGLFGSAKFVRDRIFFQKRNNFVMENDTTLAPMETEKRGSRIYGTRANCKWSFGQHAGEVEILWAGSHLLTAGPLVHYGDLHAAMVDAS